MTDLTDLIARGRLDVVKVARCTCGKSPRYSCSRVSEDTVMSQYNCQRGTRIPGGGYHLGGCGKQGPEIEDAYSDEDAAATAWNAMIRQERAREAGRG